MNDKNLIFKFEPLQKEDIIGNSGTAWGTNYKINFSVNKIKFCAEYSSTTRNGDNCIEIFYENSYPLRGTDTLGGSAASLLS